ncbi:MAG TPA: hypothetical protein VGH28_21790 [Polyangiaceae bacterium]
MKSILTALVATSLVACFQVPNPKQQPGVPRVAPDRQYLLEGGAGKQRVLVWDCLDGSRIVMTNSCRQMSCESDWTVHKSMCGGGDGWWDVPGDRRKPMPPGTGW